MEDSLLAVKLNIPQTCQQLVLRPQLVSLFSQALTKSLVLVSAPAGYGKTTLVSSWLHDKNIPSTWLSLDEGDNDPIHFARYLILALRRIFPTVQEDLLGLIQEKQQAPFSILLNSIINEIERQSSTSALILDDFHTIHDQSILGMIGYLLDHMPLTLHLILISRTDPLFPLSHLRARNQLLEIRADQLRFTREETAAFLNDVLALNLSSDDIAALETRTEGWIAGLQLASIAIQSHTAKQNGKDVHRFVSAFTGSHYYIMDYLAEEVLSLQSDKVRSFLLQTSILGNMCGSLCDAIVNTDEPDNSDGQSMLETLEQMNLFLIPLDEERCWYRYHHLFTDVLSRHLELKFAHQLPGLHHRASQWFEQNGLIYDAIYHALKAGDKERAAKMVDGNGCELLIRGEVLKLIKWIDAVEPYSKILPWIAIQKGWALCLSGQLDRAEEPLETAEQLVSSLEPDTDSKTMSGTVTACRAFRANMLGEAHLAEDLARQALDSLPSSNDFSCSLRSVATSILGDASWANGNLEQAQHAYTDAVKIGRAAGSTNMMIITSSNLGDIMMEEGKLYQAAKIYTDILQMATLPYGQMSPLACHIFASLSWLAYEGNRLEEAAQFSNECIELSRQWGNIESQAVGFLVQASLGYRGGNLDKAQQAMLSAERLANERAISPWRSMWIKSELARLWIFQGDLRRASELVQNSKIRVDNISNINEIPYLLEPVYIVLLRLYLARNEFDTALALGDRLLKLIQETSRLRRMVEILILQSLAYQGRKDMDQAQEVLERALSFAQQEGYVCVFLDEGESMVKLLFHLKANRICSEYASKLLLALGKAPGIKLAPAQLLVEQLTLRELEVLKLIEAGYSNQDIAGNLVISLPTVKRHISNIYAKLGVKSRTQAVSLGRELSLLDL